MTEDGKRTFDAITETIKVVALIVGGLWAINTWRSDQTEHAQAAKRELQKPFFEKQLSLYLEASKIAARLAYLKEHSQKDDATEARFWELYWGELALVESTSDNVGSASIESHMIEVCKQYYEVDKCHDPKMRSAIDLAHQASKEIKASWDVEKLPLIWLNSHE